MAVWSDKETLKLIEIWKEETIQEQLEGSKQNCDVYDKISREMATAGFTRSGPQCREKVKKLRGKYKKIKDGLKQTGNKRKTCKFYEELDNVMGHKLAISPPVILDTFEDPPSLPHSHSVDKKAIQNTSSSSSDGSSDAEGKGDGKGSSEA